MAQTAYPSLLFCLLLLTAAACRQETATRSAEPQPPQISLRNATRQVVEYRMLSPETQEVLQNKRLRPQAVDYWPASDPVDIQFQKGKETKDYRLQPGQPYAFRYDEHDQLDLYDGSHGRTDAADLAPFVPTPMPVVEGMLMLAKVQPQDLVVDIGCGDGRIVIAAAQRYGARGVGIELDPKLAELSRQKAREAGVADRITILQEDATRSDYRQATVVALYLLPESNELLRSQLEKQLAPGTRVVTHNYPIPGWDSHQVTFVLAKDENGQEHSIFLYRR